MNKTRLKFIGSSALVTSTLGVLLAVLGQLNFIGNARPEPVAVKMATTNTKKQPKYSFYDELKKRKTEVDSLRKTQPVLTQVTPGKSDDGFRYVVQVGAFRKETDANKVKIKLESLGLPARVIKGKHRFLAQAGPFDGKNKAFDIENKLKSQQFPTLVKQLR